MTQKQKGPASAPTLPSHGSNPIPPKGSDMNAKRDSTSMGVAATDHHHRRALDVIEHAQSLIHAAWMAAGALDRDDHAAEQDALRSVLHLAGVQLCEASIAIERAQIGRASA